MIQKNALETLAAINKVAVMLHASASGQPIKGLEALAHVTLPSGVRIPLGRLVSDHAGYMSFDLAPAGNAVQTLLAEHFHKHGSTPIADASLSRQTTKKSAIAPQEHKEMAIVITLRTTPELRVDILRNGVGLIRDTIFADILLDQPDIRFAQCAKRAVAIQNPSLSDWTLSPGSFVLNPSYFLGEDGCENLYPANFATQRFRFHQLIRDTSAAGEFDKHHSILRGWSLEYTATWQPLGHTLGKLVYTLPLAPGEIANVAIVDWSRKSVDSRFDDLTVAEQLLHSTHRDRTISETVEAALEEWQRGGSVMGGIAASLGFGGGSYSLGASAGIGGGYSTSSGDRNVTASTVQQLSDGFIQASSSMRELRSTVVVQSSQKEHAEVTTRVVANHNHAHSLTILYYEVLHHYGVTTEFSKTRPCLLVNYADKKIDFSDEANIRKYHHLLKSVLLDRALAGVFDLIEKHLYYTKNIPKAKKPADYTFTSFQIKIKTGDDGTGGDVFVSVRLKNNKFVDLYFDESDSDDKRVLDKSGYSDFDDGDDDSYVLTSKTPITWGDISGLKIRLDGSDNWEIAHVKLVGFAEEGDFTLCNSDVNQSITNNSIVLTTKKPSNTLVQSADDKFSEAGKLLIYKLKNHLVDNSRYYNRAVWLLEDPNERAVRFASMKYAGKALLDLLENRPIEVLGDHVAFPTNHEGGAIPRFETSKSEKLMTLPTRGVFAEAKLGHCNAAEIIDNTRFWDWQTSPITETAPDIQPPSTESRNVTQNTSPTQMPNSVVNIVNPSPAPDPTGMAAALGLLGKSEIFRNMSVDKDVADLLGKLSSNSISMADASKKAQSILGGSGSTTSGGGAGSSGGISTSASKGGVTASTPQQFMDWMNAIKNSGLPQDQKDKLTQGLVSGLEASPAATTSEIQVDFLIPDPADRSKMVVADVAKDAVKLGRFDNAFLVTVPTDPPIVTLNNDFIDNDSQRFQLQIVDASIPVTQAEIQAEWSSVFSVGQVINPAASKKITLTRQGPSYRFVSKPLMIVYEPVDAPPTVDGVARDADNYRVKIGGMFSAATVSYGGKQKTIPVFQPKKTYNVPISIFIFRNSSGNPVISEQEAVKRISELQDVYEYLGIFFNAVSAYTFPDTSLNPVSTKIDVPGKNGVSYWVNVINPISGIDITQMKKEFYDIVGKTLVANPHPIRIFFVEDFDPTYVEGIACNASYVQSAGLDSKTRYCLFLDKNYHPYVVAHELGHLLMDKLAYLKAHGLPIPTEASNKVYQHHYHSNNPQYPDPQNLMYPTAANSPTTVFSPKRLWNVADAEGYNQVEDLIANIQGLLQGP